MNLKWIKDLHVTATTIKFLEENIGVNLHDLALGIGFLDMASKVQAKKKKNKLDFIKFEDFCASKALSSKKITHRMGKLFANHILI